ncbi:hypothetical protein BOTBODRAFT_181703 [Botryobasidium botryosum FD-172 SS1]|uniref:Uncharacterized protein n=1 Tax=Botryobasidium botryosum (strain FD-172 SS1) TaxID=930990 RepID=A0A067LTE0_BOTB1|nr:hypothetical protein BOTBODRAFT_181703 [Botryobasidium botryosum FD-172 SS1]
MYKQASERYKRRALGSSKVPSVLSDHQIFLSSKRSSFIHCHIKVMSPAPAITNLVSYRFHPYNTRAQKKVKDLFEVCTEIYNNNFNLADQSQPEGVILGDQPRSHHSISGDISPIRDYSQYNSPYRPQSPYYRWLSELEELTDPPVFNPTTPIEANQQPLFNSPTPIPPSPISDRSYSPVPDFLVTDPKYQELIETYRTFIPKFWITVWDYPSEYIGTSSFQED